MDIFIKKKKKERGYWLMHILEFIPFNNIYFGVYQFKNIYFGVLREYLFGWFIS